MTTTAKFHTIERLGRPLRVLSLCTGIAGDVAAFRHAGVPHEVVAVAEFDPVASAVLASKFPGVPNLGDINEVSNWKDYHGRIDALVAGIPCQPYSPAGRQLGSADRRDLSVAFCDIVAAVQPSFVLVENVPAFETVQQGRPFRAFANALRDAGHAVGHHVIDARDVVAQRRNRLFLCGHRGEAGCSPDALLADAVGGLGRAAKGGEAHVSPAAGAAGGPSVLHPPRLGTLMASGAGMTRAGLKGHELDFLVVQEFPGHGLVVRRPTLLEALRAQGFPDDWLDGVEYQGRPLTDLKKYQLVGNSWPVPVAGAILKEIATRWASPA